MAKKPSYEELEQRVKELEKKADKRDGREDGLRFLSWAVQQSSDGIAISDLDGNVLFVNNAFAAMHGYSSEELIGKHLHVFHTSEQAPAVEAANRQLKDTGEFSGEIWHTRSDGTVFNTLMHNSLLRDEAGNPIGMIGTIREITERERAEAQLIESEEKFRAIFEGATDGLLVADLETKRFPIGNAMICEMLGYSPEEITNLTVADIHPLEDLPHVLDQFEKQVRGEITRSSDISVKRKDGTLFYADINSSLISFSGKPYIMGTFRDITERKRAEEALRESESRYRTLFNNANDIILIHDLSGHTIDFNQVTCERLGYSRQELLGMTPMDIDTPEYAALVPERINELREFGHITFETAHVTREGKTIPTEVSARLVEFAGKSAVLSIARDITRRKQAEEALQTAYDQSIIYAQELKEEINKRKKSREEKKKLEAQLLHAQKMESIGTLAGGVAHDFNNLLMGIQGYASLILKDLDETQPQYSWVRRIEDQVKSGAELTRQLLGFARGGKYDVKFVDINELVRKSSSMFGRTKKEITIKEEYEQDLWTVEVDRGQIEQVLLNLYVNAWHAMPAGGDLCLETSNVTLEGSFAKPYELQRGRYVKISVTDTGTGMDRATQERIFDPFFTTKQLGRGTGLGLASAYGIVRNHNGIINVYSKKNHGSTFSIYLPAAKPVAPRAKPVVRDEQIKRGTETILLVDDEQTVLDVGKELLRELGYTVLGAADGREAFEIYKENHDKIDLVVLDMVMPHMGGGEVYDRMKEINPEVRVLLSSGYSIDSQAKEILGRGCDGFIQKPFSMQELSGKIRVILER